MTQNSEPLWLEARNQALIGGFRAGEPTEALLLLRLLLHPVSHIHTLSAEESRCCSGLVLCRDVKGCFLHVAGCRCLLALIPLFSFTSGPSGRFINKIFFLQGTKENLLTNLKCPRGKKRLASAEREKKIQCQWGTGESVAVASVAEADCRESRSGECDEVQLRSWLVLQRCSGNDRAENKTRNGNVL